MRARREGKRGGGRALPPAAIEEARAGSRNAKRARGAPWSPDPHARYQRQTQRTTRKANRIWSRRTGFTRTE